MKRKIIHSQATEKFYTSLGICEAVRIGQVIEVSGQVGWDENSVPAKDFEGQVRLMFKNMITVLEKAGASANDIIELRMFVVPQKEMTLMEMIDKAFQIKKELMPENTCAATGVGIAELVIPELMLECGASAYIAE